MASEPQFGGYAAQVAPQRTATALPTATPEDYGAGIGEALTGAGRVAGDIAIDRRRLETQREYDRQALAAMADWAIIQEKYGVADNEARSAPAAPGAAGHTQAMSELAEKMGEDFLGTISHEGLREQYRARIAEWSGNRLVEADAFERGQTAKLGADQAEVTGNTYANQVRGQPLEKYIEKLAEWRSAPPPTGVPQDIWARMIRDGDQKITIGWLRGQEPEVRRAVLDARTFDDMLTPEQVNALGNEADSDIRRKQIEADAAARAAKADDTEYVDDVLDRINRGYPVPDDEYAEAMTRAQRSGLDRRVRDLNDAHVGKQVNKEWANATPAQMDARIKVIDAALAKAGDKGSPALVAERTALAKLLTERTAQVKNDPLAAGAAMGIEVGPVDWSDPASVAARRKAADATARALGVPAKYLTDEEATQMAANATTPAGQLGIARQLRQLGPRGATAAAQQVLPGDNLFTYSTGLSPDVQERVLRGVGLRKEYPVPDNRAQEIWRETTGGALSSLPAASREGAYLAAKELYRQRASAKGVEEFDPVLYRGAVREALGGDVASKTGGVGSWNGAAIMLPPSMTQQQFDARLGNYKPTRAYRGDKSRIGGAELRDRFTPVLQPNGNYQFRSDRGEWAVVEDGRTPLEVDVSKLAPATGAAARSQRAPASQRRPVYVAPPAPKVQGPRSAYEGL